MFLHKTMALKTIINLICIKIEVILTMNQFFLPEEKQRTGLSASLGCVLRLSSFTQSSLTHLKKPSETGAGKVVYEHARPTLFFGSFPGVNGGQIT